jgi:hypothetical protein
MDPRSSYIAGKSILNRAHHTTDSSNPALLGEGGTKFLASFLFAALLTSDHTIFTPLRELHK